MVKKSLLVVFFYLIYDGRAAFAQEEDAALTDNALSVQVLVTYQSESSYQLFDGFGQARFPADVKVQFLPAIIWPSWRLFAKLHLLIDAVERPELHAKIFAHIHQQQHRNRDLAYWQNWLQQQGIDNDTFKNKFYSYELNSELSAIEQLQKQQAISSVPTIIINNKEKFEAADLKTTENAIQIVADYIRRPAKEILE